MPRKPKGTTMNEELQGDYEIETVELVADYDEGGELFDADAEQAADEANAWVEGRMWKKELPSAVDGERRFLVVVMDLHTRKIAGEFYAVDGEHGIRYENVHALLSRVGERSAEKPFRAEGWSKAKDVRYNTLTHEIDLRY